MSLSVTVSNGLDVSTYELAEEFPLENLVVLVVAELGEAHHKPEHVGLIKDGRDVLVDDRSKTLKDVGIMHGDLLHYRYKKASLAETSHSAQSASLNQNASSSQAGASATFDNLPAAPANVDPAVAKRMFDLLSQIKLPPRAATMTPEEREQKRIGEHARKIFDAMGKYANIKADVYRKFPKVFEQYNKKPDDFAAFKAVYIECLNNELKAMQNPFSAEGQLAIQKLIDEQNIQMTYERAMETMPEQYFSVHMLYIRLKVNGCETIAFIDTGAQVSIMSERFCERVGLNRLMDNRFRLVASGVGGFASFSGQVHACQLQVNDHFFECKFNVLKDREMDVLIGLDVMRRHQCIIDLGKNRMVFSDETATEFLSDAEIAALKPAPEEADVEVDKEKLEKVMAVGFAEAEATLALKKYFNDVEHAINYLFNEQAKQMDQK